MGLGNRVGRALRTPVFGIAVLTPVVLAGAVAATPARVAKPVAPAEDELQLAAILPAPVDTKGVTVVPMAKPPADFRFAANTLSPPPPAAVISSAGGMRIPAVALAAYRKAEQTMAVAAPGCGVSWNLLAGIGRIESSHANGGATDASGTAARPIYGPTLDGSLPGNEIIVQGNAGGRPVYARAMGPMQFLPGTWSRFASDGDGDGKADPQNIFDAALGTARYLCSGGLNLRNQAQVLTAILRYNNSMAYAQNVLGWAASYATGVAPVDLPPIVGPAPALGDSHLERPEGLGPGMTGLPNGDPLAQLALNMGNSQTAGQMLPGPLPGPAVEGLGPAHGCEVICMASQLAPSQAPNPDLPPWMQPMTPPPWMAPEGPLPGVGPAGTGPLPGAAPLPGPAPADAPGPLPGMPAVAGPLPGMPPAPDAAGVPGMPPPAAAEAPAAPPAPLPWMAPPPPAPGPVPGPAPAPGPVLPVTGALPGPA
ncbi:MAG: lytic murein transglycosylase [Mycobacterium sp.]